MEKYVEKIVHIRPKLIHQLDSATSGVMLLGLNRKAAAKAAKQFERRLTRKYYMAAVEGKVESKIRIDQKIADDKADPKGFKMKVSNDSGLTALTELIPLIYSQQLNQTLVLLKPHTGRRHQLRVHCAFIGHPIVGDLTYNDAMQQLRAKIDLDIQ